MKQLLPLIRLQLMEFFPLSALRNTADAAARKQARRRLTSTIVTCLACAYMAVAYSMPMLVTLDESNYGLVPALMLTSAAILGAVSTLSRAGAVMFSAGNLDPLLSLPLDRKTVVLSRIFSLYFEELLIHTGMILTSGICCAIRLGSLSPTFWPALIVTILLAPLIPMGVGGLLGLFVAMLTARMKKKSIFTTIISLIFVAGIMVFSFNAGTLFADAGAVSKIMQDRIFGIYPPARLFVESLQGNLAALALFVGVALAAAILLGLAAVKGFLFFYDAINATASSKAFRMGRQKQTGILLALCQKELRQKYNTPVWILNTDIGTLMTIALTVVLTVAGKDQIQEVLETVFGRGREAAVLFGLIIAVVQCMNLTATASVSMEGNGLWLIKSLPIRADVWLRSKLLVSMLPPAVGGLVCSLVLTIGWRLSVWTVPVIFGMCLLFAWAFSVVELALGLRFARFDWVNPTEVVKQSGGVLLSMLITFLIVGAGAVLVIFLGNLGAAVLCALLLLVAGPIRLVMGKRAEKMLTKL